MTRSDTLTTDNEVNKVLKQHDDIGYDTLPRVVRSRLKALTGAIHDAAPGDVAYDMAMNDRGTSIARAQHRQDELVQERRRLLMHAYADMLQRKGVFTS